MNENLKTIRTAYEEEYKGTLDIKTYIKINEAFSNLLTRTLFNGRKVTLPYHLGTVEIIGKKLKIKRNKEGGLILPVDWYSTKKLWEKDEECKKNKQLVYHFNDHSNGYKYYFLWKKNNSYVKPLLRKSTQLKMTRANNRLLTKYLKQGREYRYIN